MGVRSAVVELSKTYQPPDIQHMAGQMALWFAELRKHEANRVISGLCCVTPTTASTQITGTGNTDWNINVGAGVVTVGGVAKHFEAQADFNVHTGSHLMASLYTCVAAIVCLNTAGVITMVPVTGTPALTAGGTAVGPTDAAIQAAVGAGLDWVKIAECTLNRTGDTTVTQSQDNTQRPMLGINVQESFGDL